MTTHYPSDASRSIFQPKTSFSRVEPDPVAPHLRPGDTVGDFKLITLVGRGGMGSVWEAEEQKLNRKVALKLIRPERIDDKAIAMFQREARAGGRLSHPGLVSVYSYGEADGVHYIAQELVGNGHHLGNVIAELREQDSLPKGYYREVAEFIIAVADAMQAAHDAGVIHRDLKPQNILVDDEGQPLITDFGLARIVGEETLSGHYGMLGTYYYMSPEQAMAKSLPIDRRTDIFSMGTILYELLFLARPFNGSSPAEIQEQIIWKNPPRTDVRLVRQKPPRDLMAINLMALRKEPSQRYQSSRDLAKDLLRFLNDRPILARRESPTSRITRAARRHPVQATLLSLIFLLAGTILLAFGPVRGWYLQLAARPIITAIKASTSLNELRGEELAQLWRLACGSRELKKAFVVEVLRSDDVTCSALLKRTPEVLQSLVGLDVGGFTSANALEKLVTKAYQSDDSIRLIVLCLDWACVLTRRCDESARRKVAALVVWCIDRGYREQILKRDGVVYFLSNEVPPVEAGAVVETLIDSVIETTSAGLVPEWESVRALHGLGGKLTEASLRKNLEILLGAIDSTQPVAPAIFLLSAAKSLAAERFPLNEVAEAAIAGLVQRNLIASEIEDLAFALESLESHPEEQTNVFFDRVADAYHLAGVESEERVSLADAISRMAFWVSSERLTLFVDQVCGDESASAFARLKSLSELRSDRLLGMISPEMQRHLWTQAIEEGIGLTLTEQVAVFEFVSVFLDDSVKKDVAQKAVASLAEVISLDDAEVILDGVMRFWDEETRGDCSALFEAAIDTVIRLANDETGLTTFGVWTHCIDMYQMVRLAEKLISVLVMSPEHANSEQLIIYLDWLLEQMPSDLHLEGAEELIHIAMDHHRQKKIYQSQVLVRAASRTSIESSSQVISTLRSLLVEEPDVALLAALIEGLARMGALTTAEQDHLASRLLVEYGESSSRRAYQMREFHHPFSRAISTLGVSLDEPAILDLLQKLSPHLGEPDFEFISIYQSLFDRLQDNGKTMIRGAVLDAAVSWTTERGIARSLMALGELDPHAEAIVPLLELLKSPLAIGRAQREVLMLLSNLAGVPLPDIPQAVEWAIAAGLEEVVLAPPLEYVAPQPE